MSHLPPPVITFIIYEVGPGAPGPDFTYPFPVDIDASTLNVLVQTPGSDVFRTQEQDIDYVWDKTGSRIIFVAGRAPTTGSFVRIERFTDRRRVLDYVGGSTLTADNLNDENNQEFYILQELESGLSNALRKNLAGAAWDSEGLPSINAAPTTDPDGWVTLAQLESIIFGSPITEVDDARTYQFFGTGGRTIFELGETFNTTAQQLIVTIDGVVQHSFDSQIYRVLNPGDAGYDNSLYTGSLVIFDIAPVLNQLIEIRHFKGTVASGVQAGDITGTEIQDGSLNSTTLFSFPGTGDRRLVFRPAGSAFLQAENSVTPFQDALLAYLGNRQLSDLSNGTADPFVDENMRIEGGRNLEFLSGGGRITGLLTPASGAETDAANRKFVNDAIAAATALGEPPVNKAEHQSVPSMPWLFNETKTVALGFRPEWVAMTAIFINDTATGFGQHPGTVRPIYCTYTVVFRSGQDTVIATAPGFGYRPTVTSSPQAVSPPMLKFTRVANTGNLTIQMVTGGSYPDQTSPFGAQSNVLLDKAVIYATRTAPST
jgi:hypothetical protein